MFSLHRCNTQRHPETIVSLDASIQALKQDVSKYKAENAYHNLVQGNVEIQFEQKADDFAIPLRRNIFGLYLIPIVIYNRTYWFILDTGAQISSIRPSILQHMHLQKLPGSVSVGSVGGKEKAMHGYLLPKIEIGKLHIHQLPVVALDPQDFSFKIGDFDAFQFDGILGWDILSKLDFEIDDVGKQFKVMKNRFLFTYENMIPTMFPIFLVKGSDGNLLKMGFDSGSRMSWMCEQSAETLGLQMSEPIQAKGFGVHGIEDMNVRMVKELDLYLFKAHVNIKNMITGRTNIFPNLELDGILGNEIFKNRRIRLINSKAIVLLT